MAAAEVTLVSQAEIAGGTLSSPNELPSKGRRLRDFALPSSSGGAIHLSDYRGHANLVLIVSDERPQTAELLSEAARQYLEIRNEGAEVLAILHTSAEQAASANQRLKLPFPLLADEGRGVHRELGAVDSQGLDSAAVYVTDRFGEVFGVYRTAEGQQVPDIADVLNWLEFVNAQCPECEPPEWPI
jgi:peroxiredoxin